MVSKRIHKFTVLLLSVVCVGFLTTTAQGRLFQEPPTVEVRKPRLLQQVLAHVQATSAITIVCDKNLAKTHVPSAVQEQASAIEIVAALAQHLPGEAVVARLWLPDRERPYKTDDLVEYARVLADLGLLDLMQPDEAAKKFGDQTLSLYGKALPPPVMASARLHPVYLIFDPDFVRIHGADDFHTEAAEWVALPEDDRTSLQNRLLSCLIFWPVAQLTEIDRQMIAREWQAGNVRNELNRQLPGAQQAEEQAASEFDHQAELLADALKTPVYVHPYTTRLRSADEVTGKLPASGDSAKPVCVLLHLPALTKPGKTIRPSQANQKRLTEAVPRLAQVEERLFGPISPGGYRIGGIAVTREQTEQWDHQIGLVPVYAVYDSLRTKRMMQNAWEDLSPEQWEQLPAQSRSEVAERRARRVVRLAPLLRQRVDLMRGDLSRQETALLNLVISFLSEKNRNIF